MEVDGRFPSLSNTRLDPTSQGEATTPLERANQRSGRLANSGDTSGEKVELFMAELSEVSDIRQNRVDALKQAIAQGTYRVDAHKVASAMWSEVFG